jgi:hypothetical protein
MEIQAGNELTVAVRAFATRTTNTFEDMSIDKRNCKLVFYEGAEDIIIDGLKYSDINCLMQHNIKSGIANCKCYPWYYFDDNSILLNASICDSFGIACFKQFVQETLKDEHYLQTECLEPCSLNKYTSSLTNQRPSNQRRHGDPTHDAVFGYFLKTKRSIITKLRHNETLLSFENRRWAKTSIVHVNFEDPQVTFVIKDAKVTFEDKLANIGGTFGLFLGFSFVGVIDWITPFMVSSICSLKSKIGFY